jgi:hypothetical protein
LRRRPAVQKVAPHRLAVPGLAVLAACFAAFIAPAYPAGLELGIAERFQALSMSLPTTGRVVICHGFGCQRRTEIGLSSVDQAHFVQVMAAGKPSAEAERRAVAQAVAWFQKRVAPETGTANAKAFATIIGDPSQFDCVDSSTNTTQVLIVLDQLGLLHHHRVEAPVSRPLGWHVIHTTAVLRDVHSQQDWSIDSWTRNNGEPPEIMPLAKWLEG